MKKKTFLLRAKSVRPVLFTESKSRKLDSWIARRVMGWETVARSADDVYPELEYWAPGDGTAILKRRFRPTTEVASAAQVLKKCAEHRTFSLGADNGVYTFESLTVDGKVVRVSDCSFELAVCKFAQKLFTK